MLPEPLNRGVPVKFFSVAAVFGSVVISPFIPGYFFPPGIYDPWLLFVKNISPVGRTFAILTVIP
jgi:ABC-type multidrug transport system permease subunit